MAKLDLHIGVPVHGKDKHCGKLSNIVLDPETQQVTSLIVEQGLFLKSARVIPLSLVMKATSAELFLDLTCEELADYASYQETEVREPVRQAAPVVQAHGLAPGFASGPASQQMVRKRIHEGVAAGSHVIGRKTGIANFDSTLGSLDHVIVDSQSGKISELVMRRGIFPSYHVIPADSIESFSDEAIRVAIADDDLVSLPRFESRSDGELLDSLVGAILAEDSPAFKGVEPTVEGGVAVLSGEVPSEAIRRHAEELARMVPGILDVENRLVVRNGMYRHSSNGHDSNGHDSNGHDSNGHGANGNGSDGHGLDGAEGDGLRRTGSASKRAA